MTKSQQSLYEKYQAQLDGLLDNHWDTYKGAPLQRQWDKMFGMSIPSKNDLTRALQSNIQCLSAMCERRTGKALWSTEPEETLKGGPVD
jgi:hypothetical protein